MYSIAGKHTYDDETYSYYLYTKNRALRTVSILIGIRLEAPHLTFNPFHKLYISTFYILSQ